MSNSKLKCTICKKYFDADSDEIEQMGVVSLCRSAECREKYLKGGQVKSKKSKPDISSEVYEEVVKLDGNKCRWCGVSGEVVKLDCHHIKYRGGERGPHTVDNLIMLCVEHHIDGVHSNKRLWQPYCFEIVELRKTGDKATTIRDLYRRDYGKSSAV